MTRVTSVINEYLEHMAPAELLKHDAAMRRVIDPAEYIKPEALSPHLAPLVLRWGPSDTGRWPIARSGRAVLLQAFAESAPTTGSAIITLTTITEFSGDTTITTLSIPKGQQFGGKSLPLNDSIYEFPTGAWVGAKVTTANGASGVSIALSISVF